MRNLFHDVRYGMRMLGKSPAFAFTAVLTLGLGIGANTVVFSILNTLYQRPPAVPHAEQLVLAQLKHRAISPAEYSFYREHNSSFSGLAAEWPTSHTYFANPTNPRMVLTAIVSANYFNVLEIHPALGRFFLPEDDQAGPGPTAAVLSDHLWRSDYGGDANVVGKTIKLNGRTQTIIGVAPPWFHGILAGTEEDLWLPTQAAAIMDSSCGAKAQTCQLFDDFIARLKPDRAIGAAQDEMNALNQRWEAIYPDLEKSSILVYWARGLHPSWRSDTSPLPRLLLSTVAVLLLIACANVAGLLLVRGRSRSKEIAVRLALGAGRGRIVRQLLTEAALLAVAGCGLGLLLLRASQSWLSSFPFHGSEGFAVRYDMSLDRPVLLATMGISAFAVFVFGLAPALLASRPAPMLALKNGDTSAAQPARFRGILVVGQVALASALSCAALLVARSLDRVLMGLGSDPSHVAIIRLTPSKLGYTSQRSAALQTEALQKLAADPEVESVSLAQLMPWWESYDAWIALPGQSKMDERSRVHAFFNNVAPNFFATLQIPLRQGRDFSDLDRKNAPRVIVINETMANRMWPDESALGHTLVVNGLEYAVIGVAQDSQYNPASDLPHLFFYMPYWQNRDGGDARFFIRTKVAPGPILRRLKLVIRGIDPDLPVGEDSTMVEGLLSDFGPLRLARVVLVFSGAAALFLSSIGLYGVLAFLVARRTREIGIRMALGATRNGILTVFLNQGMKLALLGVIAGSVLGLTGTRLLAALLYGVSPGDPVVFTVVASIVMMACLLASYIPARRATRVDPMEALRYE